MTVPLQFLASTVFIAWDVCDYPLSVRGIPLGERIRFVLQNVPAVLGYAAGIALIALIPCGFLAVLPAGVAGATKLIALIEAHRGAAQGNSPQRAGKLHRPRS